MICSAVSVGVSVPAPVTANRLIGLFAGSGGFAPLTRGVV
jgi:hypothetical protein